MALHRFIDPAESFLIERAISYLVSEYGKSGFNPKPVVLHSLRVGLHLLELGYETRVISAGVLHDLLEDTSVSSEQLERDFGGEVAGLVKAVSVKPGEQYNETFARILAVGQPAVVIKAADLHSNCLYIRLVRDRKDQEHLFGQIACFLELAREFSDEPAVIQLEIGYRRELERLLEPATRTGTTFD